MADERLAPAGAPGAATRASFRAAYAAQRAAEGRAYSRDELFALPYLASGPTARQWAVRARSYDALVRHVLAPAAREVDRPLRVADLGAGNGWLSWRVALAGGAAVAVDLRDDAVDGLGAARRYVDETPARFERVAGSFDALPLASGWFDVAVFNAALHYALDLGAALAEARRVVASGGRLAIVDSPFYASAAHGEAMLRAKRAGAARQFGERADALLALPFVEYLTAERLTTASAPLGLRWRRRRVRYPLWYETRPVVARLRGARPPSRFDLWECPVG